MKHVRFGRNTRSVHTIFHNSGQPEPVAMTAALSFIVRQAGEGSGSPSVAMLKKMKRIFYLLENTFEIQNKLIIFAE